MTARWRVCLGGGEGGQLRAPFAKPIISSPLRYKFLQRFAGRVKPLCALSGVYCRSNQRPPSWSACAHAPVGSARIDPRVARSNLPPSGGEGGRLTPGIASRAVTTTNKQTELPTIKREQTDRVCLLLPLPNCS